MVKETNCSLEEGQRVKYSMQDERSRGSELCRGIFVDRVIHGRAGGGAVQVKHIICILQIIHVEREENTTLEINKLNC